MDPQSYLSNFDKNIEKFTQFYPLAGLQISFILRDQKLKFCLTKKGEDNLVAERFGIKHYYHSQEDAREEAKLQTASEDLKSTQVFYHYGLGLGYIYDELVDWLRAAPDHYLIFFEDDLEVIFYFLHTERATRLLNDRQVLIFYFQEYTANYLEFYALQTAYLALHRRFLVLPYYAQFREIRSISLCYFFLNESDTISKLVLEFILKEKGLLNHFYDNLFHLPKSLLANELFNKFKNVPAIICGAGPSFGKNILLLKQLTDKALIFGGGSSLNILSYYGITPHFGMGLDPNIEQYNRLLTNHTFYVPFFYRNRLAHGAFQSVEGPKLYVSGAPNLIAQWFEKELGLPTELIEEGHNVIHLETQLAIRLGCNPIIFVGLDLAYTNTEPYAKGIGSHPLYLDSNPPYMIENKEVVKKVDIYGNPILTQWPWVEESNWMNNFISNHPENTFINATEGGLGFSNAENMTLAQVHSKYLEKSYDLLNWVHAELQNCTFRVKQTLLTKKFYEFKSSFLRCLDSTHKILKLHSISPTPPFFDTPTILEEVSINGEIVYQHLLKEMESALLFKNLSDLIGKRQNCQIDEELATVKFHNQRYQFQFLEDAIKENCFYMDRAVLKFLQKPHVNFNDQTSLSPFPSIHEGYQLIDNQLLIDDAELGIHIETNFILDTTKDRFCTYYSDGQLKSENWVKEHEIHGPSRFFHENGQLLAESWYIEGKKEGKTWQYSPSGILLSLRRYLKGELHGKQQFFYPDGTLNVQLEFQQGHLDGVVSVQDPFGRLKRELHYLNGKRHGTEKMWQDGTLIMECNYENGIPVGEGYLRDIRGKVIKKSVIHNYPRDFDLINWDSNGKVIREFKRGIEDFTVTYQDTEKGIQDFEASIQKMLSDLDKMNQPEYAAHINQNDLALLKKSIQELEEHKKSLIEIMEKNRNLLDEQINQHVWNVKNYN